VLTPGIRFLESGSLESGSDKDNTLNNLDKLQKIAHIRALKGPFYPQK
jgi:hypothetical protein